MTTKTQKSPLLHDSPKLVVEAHLGQDNLIGAWLTRLFSVGELHTWGFSPEDVSLILDCALSAHTKTPDKLMSVEICNEKVTEEVLRGIRLQFFQDSTDSRHPKNTYLQLHHLEATLKAHAPVCLYHPNQPRWLRMNGVELPRLALRKASCTDMCLVMYALLGIVEARERFALDNPYFIKQ